MEKNNNKTFQSIFEAPADANKLFEEYGELVTTRKGQTLKHPGQTEKYLSLIIRGSGGVMFWNNDKLICTDLCYDGDFLSDHMSFLLQKPTLLEVITFEPTELVRISRHHFDKLTSDPDYGSKISRSALEALYVQKQSQQIEMSTKTATERYIELLNKNPDMISRTPQKYIASYLGIQTQSLSRIRRTITTNYPFE
jgi:CRP-like cAMP-binding protein